MPWTPHAYDEDGKRVPGEAPPKTEKNAPPKKNRK